MKRYIRSSELTFERKEGLGLNNPVLKLSNGDEIVLKGMSYEDEGDNQVDLPCDDTMEDHFQESFLLKGVGGKKYDVTREVTLYKKDAPIKGGRWKQKIVKVSEV